MTCSLPSSAAIFRRIEPVRIVGLTGGIGMGKSTAAATFRRLGVKVFDADAAVHALQARGGAAVAPIAAAFAGVVHDGAVDRAALRAQVVGDRAALGRLEAIVHPLVGRERRRFLDRARREGRRIVLLDIPLLFETKAERACDAVVVVSAPAAVQRARVRSRKRMTDAQIDAIIARQMNDHERRRRADVVLRTGIGRRHTQAAIARLLARWRDER